jgi:hypothetical protein
MSYIWLATERKLDGGSLHYSVPITSYFNYDFADLEKYSIRWTESVNSNVNNNCLALHMVHKKLHVLSCDESLHSLCLTISFRVLDS